ncbi:ATP-grasp domain-containing protein [Acinetobacter sp. SwsAc4]|uniref:ATP-grasp domain-containing protein n=1 Tax=Acinetobacter sp. SwsAc4 TaxID=2749437 RepID=UPI0015BA5333|nr:ATP-grasp domain-containing protein [Acinetobacter sp. SwsAc4]NWK80878.1 ATP-grasp domain-containing protein [Acinetobacter sp. SwsAc4]
MTKILITAAGTGTAFSYVNSIAKNFPQLEILTADTNVSEHVTSSLFAKKHYVVTDINSNTLLKELEDISVENNISFYLPLIDLEIKKSFSSNILSKILVSNSKKFCEDSLEKNNYEKNFNLNNLMFPYIFKNTIDKDKDYILKKNGGFGGRATKNIKGKDIGLYNSEFYIYEKIIGEEFTVDCFPYNDVVYTSVRKRLEVKNGVCVKAEIIQSDYLNNVANEFAKKYFLKSPFCFQVIEKENKFYLIDVNPRLGAGSSMSAVNGMDFFSAHLALLLGEDPLKYLQKHHDRCIVTRQYANYLMKVY